MIWLPIILVLLLYAVLATVAAIDFGESQVHLHYLWPRGVVTTELHEIVSTGEIVSQDPGDAPLW